jgi:hypothetical protein
MDQAPGATFWRCTPKRYTETDYDEAALFLRIAAVLTFIHAVLHTIGGVFGKTEPGPPTIAVQAMRMNQFLLMGHIRSFWDFYRGLPRAGDRYR